MRAIDKVVETLVQGGIDHVFGIPGGSALGLYDGLYDKREHFDIILTRTEQGASCMAEIYGRINHKPALFTGQGAFVGSMGLFGIIEAFLTSTPMVIITDISEYGSFALHGAMHCGSGEYGSFDLMNILKSVTKFATMSTSPEETVQGVQLAIKHSISGRPGPAACVMRTPAMHGLIKEECVPRIYDIQGYLKGSKPAAPQEEIDAILEMLNQARSPVILAGNGVRMANSSDELIRFAEKMSIPVATSYLGKSCIPETHPLALGSFNPVGQPLAVEMIKKADLLLVIGCRLRPNDAWSLNPSFIDPIRQKIIQIDIDPRNFGWTYPVYKGVTGDAKEILRSLLAGAMKKIASSVPDERRENIQTLLNLKKGPGFFDDELMNSDQVPILPQRVVKELRESFDENSIFLADGGNNRHWMLRYFPAKTKDSYFGTWGIGGTGYSIPAVIAAKMLLPDKDCVAVCGDSGFSQQMTELLTAIQYGISPIIVIMNNSGLGTVKEIQKDRCIACNYIDVNFAQIAESMGCIGIRIERPQEMKKVFKEAKAQKRPVIVDIPIDKKEMMMERIYPSMAKNIIGNLSRK